MSLAIERLFHRMIGQLGLHPLRGKNHSETAKYDFVRRLHNYIKAKFDVFDSSVVLAKSNLDFRRRRSSYSLLSFDVAGLRPFRLRLDKELVGWRHSVAHGESPDLSSMDIKDHVNFASEMLLPIADSFQLGMLQRV